jgi:hypothetical protein
MLMIGLIGLGLDLAFRGLEKVRSIRWGFAAPAGDFRGALTR